MTIEYSLELGGVHAAEVAELFARIAVVEGLTEEEEPAFGRKGSRLASGVDVSVYPSPPLPFPAPVEEALGVAPQTHVLFQFFASADWQWQKQDMVRLTAALLNGTRADVVLMHFHEIVWLVRKDGRLTISDRDDIWGPDLLALLPPPFERAPLPVL